MTGCFNLKGMIMYRFSTLGSLLVMAAVSLGGCGVLNDRAGENGSEAWVTRVYEPGEMPRLQPGCADGIDLSRFRNDQFVQAREPHGRRAITVIAHVPRGLQVQAGDEVEIEPARCSKGVMPEVKQVFRQ
jgi:hypothetical protein